MPSRSARLEILNRLEKGEITPEEAASLLSMPEDGSLALAQTPMGVLGQVERGEITADEAAHRLSARADINAKRQKPPKVEVIPGKPAAAQRNFAQRPRGWWLFFVAAGAVFAVLGALWMNFDLSDGSLGLGFFCAWVPLSLGVLLLAFGWLAQRGPWANVNFKSQRGGGRVKFNFDLPVPIGVAGSALHFVGDRVPALDREDVDRLLQALEKAGKAGEPIEIRTNSDDGEDSVDITIS